MMIEAPSRHRLPLRATAAWKFSRRPLNISRWGKDNCRSRAWGNIVSRVMRQRRVQQMTAELQRASGQIGLRGVNVDTTRMRDLFFGV